MNDLANHHSVAGEPRWIGGLAEWEVGETVYLSVAFTWKVPEAYSHALFARALGKRVVAGGPAFMQPQMRELMEGVAEVPTVTAVRRGKPREIPAPHPDGLVIQRHNPMATLASRGCSEDCSFCGVPVTDGPLSLIPDFPVRPILCDNNLSALPDEYQHYIIRRYHEAGVRMIDANSGFEPKTFTEAVYRRWKPLVNAGGGPWRFGYDETRERDRVLDVMRMLRDEPGRRKRVYVLIGNESYDSCMARIQDVLDYGCEPHCQPFLSLNALERTPHPRHDWTTERLTNVARWVNRHHAKNGIPFEEYDGSIKSAGAERYDEQQGLFV